MTFKPCGLVNTLDKYKARALPNRRLVTAFGISNCFSTDDIVYCKAFHNKAEGLLTMEQDRWQTIAQLSTEIIKTELSAADQSVGLSSIVQIVTMKLALDILLQVDASRDDHDQEIRSLATEINKQWLRSKGEYDPDLKSEWSFKDQEQILTALRSIFPNLKVDDPETNPMSYILPGYEILWRVALRCYLELMARGHSEADQWKRVLADYKKDPVPEQFGDRLKQQSREVTAEMISAETLRLYPPTRRIYRDFQAADGEIRHLAADVEGCHRNTAVWGQDALKFRPERWLNSGDDESALEFNIIAAGNFMPFGDQPFMCPAKRRKPGLLPFGMSMLALITAALIEMTDGVWKVEGELPGKDHPLETDREKYAELMLVRI